MKKILFLVMVTFFCSNTFAQGSFWKKNEPNQITTERLPRNSNPSEFLVYTLDFQALKAKLASAPKRNTVGLESNTLLAFPNPEGVMQNFRIYEASVMHEDLSARYSDIKSYVGMGIDDKTAMIRFSVTLFGLHTMTFSGVNGTSYIDPYTKDLKNYMVFSKSKLSTTMTYECGVAEKGIDLSEDTTESTSFLRASNSLFKTYRLALSCTIEYAAFHVNAAGLAGGTLAQKKGAVLSAMVVTMTRVNAIYERDMALTMVLIPNNTDIINIDSDNLDNNNTAPAFPLLGQNQTFIDNVIGFNNYDIGHVATTGGGGVATRESPCTGGKARGVTGLPSPVGDEYDIDFVAHEMGHQWGGNHTFNGDQGSCGGNQTQTSAFEPGSGSTIMAYSGICAPQDVQLFSDAYLHARSLIQMMAFVNGNGNCGVIQENGNAAPVVNAGPAITIPFGTAFVLTGSATDDGDTNALTYCWEQYNNQFSPQPPVATSLIGPNFRSLNPTSSPIRFFPAFSSVLANNLIPRWEVVPSVPRILTFSLVVRDNGSPLGGQTQRATTTVTLANTGPFKVTSQNIATAWVRNSTQMITWDVAGTTANGINTTAVNIKLSIDGGVSFPYVLANNTPNDGMESIVAPDINSPNCRILIEAVGNIYYALNSKTIYIGYEEIVTCNTYSLTTPFAIPDNNSFVSRQINVPISGSLSDVNVTINLTHPNLQNLQMAFVRPGLGTLNTYFNQQCTGNADMNVTFDSQAPALTCASPTVGTYAPPTTFNLDSLNGINPQGNWSFGFKDAVTGNAGTVNSIQLEVCSQTFNLANNDFEFQNFALSPNPNDGNFNLRFTSQSSKIQITVYDLSGRILLNKQYANTGVFNQELKLDHAQSGVYLMSISDGNKKMVKRIVVK